MPCRIHKEQVSLLHSSQTCGAADESLYVTSCNFMFDSRDYNPASLLTVSNATTGWLSDCRKKHENIPLCIRFHRCTKPQNTAPYNHFKAIPIAAKMGWMLGYCSLFTQEVMSTRIGNLGFRMGCPKESILHTWPQHCQSQSPQRGLPREAPKGQNNKYQPLSNQRPVPPWKPGQEKTSEHPTLLPSRSGTTKCV